MLKPEQVPDEAAKAARNAMLAGWSDVQQIIAAAINAWPGAGGCCVFTGDQSKEWPDEYVDRHMGPAIFLPLPQEAGDE